MLKGFLGPFGSCVPTITWRSTPALPPAAKGAMTSDETNTLIQQHEKRIAFDNKRLVAHKTKAHGQNKAGNKDAAKATLKMCHQIQQAITRNETIVQNLRSGLDGVYQAEQQVAVVAAYKSNVEAAKKIRSQLKPEDVEAVAGEMLEQSDEATILNDLLSQDISSNSNPVSDAVLEAELAQMDEAPDAPLHTIAAPAQPVSQPTMATRNVHSSQTSQPASASGRSHAPISGGAPVVRPPAPATRGPLGDIARV